MTDSYNAEVACKKSVFCSQLGSKAEFTKEPLNRSVLLSRSRHGEILSRCRGGFWCLSLALSYFFVALMPFLCPFLHNRRNTAY